MASSKIVLLLAFSAAACGRAPSVPESAGGTCAVLVDFKTRDFMGEAKPGSQALTFDGKGRIERVVSRSSGGKGPGFTTVIVWGADGIEHYETQWEDVALAPLPGRSEVTYERERGRTRRIHDTLRQVSGGGGGCLPSDTPERVEVIESNQVFEYDASGRLARETSERGGRPLTDHEYRYEGDELVEIVEHRGGESYSNPVAGRPRWGRSRGDDAGRIVEYESPYDSRRYEYDRAGRLVRATRTSTDMGPTEFLVSYGRACPARPLFGPRPRRPHQMPDPNPADAIALTVLADILDTH